ncbi:hypothetical protein NPIL_226391 [Nephila pilipes]|uniref:Uncharacterized protein n=1 Tax=Nephila pilipes TaxID=299642 RepID=A0A8X6R1J4_NEPPI|nr:hypothetical protein NPIL_226391 [Nephila pilipes]
MFLNLAKRNLQLLCNGILDHDSEKNLQLEILSIDAMKNFKLRAVRTKVKVVEDPVSQKVANRVCTGIRRTSENQCGGISQPYAAGKDNNGSDLTVPCRKTRSQFPYFSASDSADGSHAAAYVSWTPVFGFRTRMVLEWQRILKRRVLVEQKYYLQLRGSCAFLPRQHGTVLKRVLSNVKYFCLRFFVTVERHKSLVRRKGSSTGCVAFCRAVLRCFARAGIFFGGSQRNANITGINHGMKMAQPCYATARFVRYWLAGQHLRGEKCAYKGSNGVPLRLLQVASRQYVVYAAGSIRYIFSALPASRNGEAAA